LVQVQVIDGKVSSPRRPISCWWQHPRLLPS